MEKEIGLSYPTLRNRLQEIIRLLGYEPGQAEAAEEERRKVLEDIAAGKLTAEQALQKLQNR